MSTPRTLRIYLLTALTSALVCACRGPDPTTDQGPAENATPASLNEICPVMGGPVDPARTIVVDHRPVAFCCQDCVMQWISLSPEEQQAALAKVFPE